MSAPIGRLAAEDVDQVSAIARALGAIDRGIGCTDDSLGVLDRALRRTEGWRISRLDLRHEEVAGLRSAVAAAYALGQGR